MFSVCLSALWENCVCVCCFFSFSYFKRLVISDAWYFSTGLRVYFFLEFKVGKETFPFPHRLNLILQVFWLTHNGDS